jgi:hypothetical protein
MLLSHRGVGVAEAGIKGLTLRIVPTFKIMK